ncbi:MULTISPECIES: TetR/AcrR family transcriptional regulator [unclassified Streptococcus]|uniref:TetR/AcrR family transcriptional regulator n=1 Tax=unclassified Streptococcus TaxID=2608887 RepID=UPI0018A8C51E|nr:MULTISPECIES: TetR/AcrR family transcriptional regulator [unclassified Streptococcus]MBF8970948.1 TetR/AcrR family transcriptional regulator [Streptococcus sp. NLN76]MBG9367157.1 TetR/AcrR family transcriptional regulator [Streptococcus sp. NLN64]MBJ6746348.1 TetR/AcrR family transcriptional regulator [Streptococcus sp. 121]
MDTRETILRQTRELIYHQGYVATSLNQIMDAAGVGKGQLYYYFKSKKDLGLEVTQNLLREWDFELIQGIFGSSLPPEDRFRAMLAWIFDFHRQQEGTIFYGCPVGNLIVELAAQDQDFRQLLADFMDQWFEELSGLLQVMHPSWSNETCQQATREIIAQIQGAIVLLKLSQDIQVIAKAMISLEERYLTYTH